MAELASSLCGLCMLVFVTRIQRESTIILCHLQVYIYIYSIFRQILIEPGAFPI